MREIKFRCWYDDRMHKVVDIDFAYKKINLFGADIINFKDGKLMQYTGLKDKNGKEIYEGDIVKFKYGYREKEINAPIKYGEWTESKCDEYDCVHYGYFVEYEWENYCENTGLDLYEINEILEVIGNIYDNPELLEV